MSTPKEHNNSLHYILIFIIVGILYLGIKQNQRITVLEAKDTSSDVESLINFLRRENKDLRERENALMLLLIKNINESKKLTEQGEHIINRYKNEASKRDLESAAIKKKIEDLRAKNIAVEKAVEEKRLLEKE